MNELNQQPMSQMVLIGATGRNSGKTTLAKKIIEKYKNEKKIIAFKLITVRNHGDICPRGGTGCGICKGLKAGYDITEETGDGIKDTMLLKKAGANSVYLIRSYTENIKEALDEALSLIPTDSLVICESNSARLAVKPACFVMIESSDSLEIKPSALRVMDQADYLLQKVEVDFEDFVENKLPVFLS